MFSLKGLIMVVWATIFLLSFLAFAQSSYYYHSAGVQNPLNLSGEKVTVKFQPSLSMEDINTLILSESALDPNKEPEPTFYEFYVLYVLPGNDIEALIQRLKFRQEILIANPVYLTPDSLELIVTDRMGTSGRLT
jgi:hypothetical protein